MEALSWSFTALSFYGFNYGQDVENKVIDEPIKNSVATLQQTQGKKWIVVRKMLRRFYHTSLLSVSFVGAILLTAYLALTAKNLDMKILTWIFTFYFGCYPLMYIWSEKYLPEISKTMFTVISRLDEKDVTRIKKMDKQSVIQRLILSLGPSIMCFTYLLTVPLDNFVMGIYSSNTYLLACHAVATNMTLVMGMQYFQYYIMVIRVGKVYADVCKRRITGQKRCKLIQASLEDFCVFVQKINECLGIIPLTMFASLFAHFTIGVTLASLHFGDVNLDLLFITFGCGLINHVAIVLEAVWTASKTSTIMKETFQSAAVVVRTSLPRILKPEVKEARKCLSVFLQQTPSVFFTASGDYNLNFASLLAFSHSLIPFTVMFITTISDAVRDYASLKERVNCTCQHLSLSKDT